MSKLKKFSKLSIGLLLSTASSAFSMENNYDYRETPPSSGSTRPMKKTLGVHIGINYEWAKPGEGRLFGCCNDVDSFIKQVWIPRLELNSDNYYALNPNNLTIVALVEDKNTSRGIESALFK